MPVRRGRRPSRGSVIVALRTTHRVRGVLGHCGGLLLLAVACVVTEQSRGDDAGVTLAAAPPVPIVIGEEAPPEPPDPPDSADVADSPAAGPERRELSLPAEADAAAELLHEPLMIETGSILAEPTVIEAPAAETIDVSARGIDGLRIDDFTVEEMPFEASSGQWFWNGGWYAGGESLWLTRSLNNRRVIAQDAADTRIKYTTMAGPFNVAPGARATIGRSLGRDHLDRDRSFEFIYYGGMAYQLNEGWNSLVANSLISPLAPNAPGFNFASSYETAMNSDFNSWE